MNLMILHWLYTYYFNQIIKLEKYPSYISHDIGQSVNFSMRDISYNDALFADIICSHKWPPLLACSVPLEIARDKQTIIWLSALSQSTSLTISEFFLFFFFFSNFEMWDHVLSFKHINNCRNMCFDLKHLNIIDILVRLII